jgi:hypothetical protein
MISHELKCIFIHIPRTAGSSIEQTLVGKDWWQIERKTKHLVASQAKKLYSEYWNDYFKFSFVRDPYSRMVSLATHFWTYYRLPFKGVLTDQHINEYKNLFGTSILIEHDWRFYKREEVINEKHRENCVYGNILDEPIDYIGKFETLEEDFNNISNILGVKGKELEKINNKQHGNSLSLEAKILINKIYDEDFSIYNYSKEQK